MIDRVREDMKQAMRDKDQLKVSCLRMLIADFQMAKTGRDQELSEETSVEIVQRAVKKRKEAAEQFDKAGRAELAQKEQEEAEVLSTYLPEQLGRDELEALVKETVAETGATTPKEMGKVMGALMPKIKGKADGKLVGELVKEALGD